MSLSEMEIGVQVLNNSWDSTSSPVHADHNVTESSLLQLSAGAGATIARIPLDLSEAGVNGFPQWLIDDIGTMLQTAKANGIKVVFQPGQTPAELTADNDVTSTPETTADMRELANRFATVVEQVYTTYGSQYSGTIAGWEVGNEPNLSYNYNGNTFVEEDPANNRFYSVSAENGTLYADYLNAVINAIDAAGVTVNGQAFDVNVISGGVAHNDADYLEAMFTRLKALGTNVDGFTIHPYTTFGTDDFGNQLDPVSGRATDWIGQPGSDFSDSWDYYYSFQGALYTMQSLMNRYGFDASQLWITEFGVPSYLGFRNAGEEGVDDQARWYAEAFGVVDSWDNDSLMGMMAHHVLDDQSAETNAGYNAFDSSTSNDGTWLEGEDSFGLYQEVNGQIVAKPVVDLMNAISNGTDYRYLNIVSNHTLSTFDFSAYAQSTGLVSGVIALTHDGNDTIIGSNFNDSLFAGTGNDTVNAGAGNDIIFGGSGNDILNGEAGNDDIYGNEGDDRISAGSGTNRVDGGTGRDTLVLTGNRSAYTWSGDGVSVTVTGNGSNTTAINIEALQFGDGTSVALTNIDLTRGNGGVVATLTSANDDVGTVYSGQRSVLSPLSNDATNTGSSLVITQINGQDIAVNGEIQIASLGTVTLNGDNTLSLVANQQASGQFQFAYTVSDGSLTSTSNIVGEVRSAIITTEQNQFVPICNTTEIAAVGVSPALFGGNHADTINGTSLGEAIRGLGGNDQINGLGGDDRLYGNAGNDTLKGGAGNDLLFGGAGSDTLYGNAGRDTFVFHQNDGNDFIADFEVGIDKIDFSLANLTSYSQLVGMFTESHGNLSIGLDNSIITLAGISASDLSAADFIL